MSSERTLPGLDPREGESRLPRPGLTLATLAVAALAAAAVVWTTDELPDSVTLATGPADSPAHLLGRGLADAVNVSDAGFGASTFATTGSTTNVILVEEGTAQFGFVHDGMPDTPYGSLRTVARLYEDVLQVVVRPGSGIVRPSDLRDKRIALGPCRSAEHRLAQSVLTQLGLEFEPWPDCHLPGEEPLRESRNPPGRLDAEAFVAGLPSDAVRRSLEAPGRLLSLAEVEEDDAPLEGVVLALDGLRATRIPARTYGRSPQEPVGSVGIGVLLVTRADVPDAVVEEVTRSLFDHRFSLSGIHPAARQFEEAEPGARFRFPLHPGAAKYYARDQPHPLVEWAEPLSLVLALSLAGGSGFLTLRQRLRQRKKNRIDVYYLELERISDDLAGTRTPEAAREIEDRLVRLRKRAFKELVAERLEADESFAIFESSLSHRMQEVAHRVESRRGSVEA